MARKSRWNGESGTTSALDRRKFLSGVAGATAAVTAVPVLSGVAAAHFPTELDIDVQPGNEENFIDVDEHESVAVAVHCAEFLNSDGERAVFDPTEKAVRYRFGSWDALSNGDGARPKADGEVTSSNSDHGHGEESDALILEFPVADAGFDGGEESAWLYWERDEAGEHGYAGVDSVRVYTEGPSRQDFFELLSDFLRSRRSSK